MSNHLPTPIGPHPLQPVDVTVLTTAEPLEVTPSEWRLGLASIGDNLTQATAAAPTTHIQVRSGLCPRPDNVAAGEFISDVNYLPYEAEVTYTCDAYSDADIDEFGDVVRNGLESRLAWLVTAAMFDNPGSPWARDVVGVDETDEPAFFDLVGEATAVVTVSTDLQAAVAELIHEFELRNFGIKGVLWVPSYVLNRFPDFATRVGNKFYTPNGHLVIPHAAEGWNWPAFNMVMTRPVYATKPVFSDVNRYTADRMNQIVVTANAFVAVGYNPAGSVSLAFSADQTTPAG